MDPDACLANFLDALRDGDRERALTALTFLHNWIATHGFLPKDPREEPK